MTDIVKDIQKQDPGSRLVTLFELELDTDIPPQLYAIVAEILAFVYQLDIMAKKRSRVRKRFSKLK